MPIRPISHLIPVILILVLFNNQVSALTDLTRLNCPDDYDVVTANTTKPNQVFVKFFYSAFDNTQFKSTVDSIVIQGKNEELSALIMKLMVPYIVILAAFFLFFMIVACCTVFQKSCPPCESWRRDFVRRPYEKFQLRCVMVFTIIFAVSVFILSIVMFTSFPVFKEQMIYTECSLYNMLDITINGEQSKQWGGFSQLKNQVGNISSLLSTASSQVNKNFKGADGLSNDDWIVDDMEAMKKANLDFYRNNKDSKLPSPNPNNPTLYVNSSFIQGGLGPNGTADTMVTDLDTALRATEVLSLQAYLIEKQSQILVDSAATITANTNSSQQQLSMYQDQLDQVQVQLSSFSADYFDQLTNWGFYVIQGLVGLILAGSIFILFGVISTHILDIMACRSMVNLGWVIYAFTYFGIIALTFIFLSMGSVGYTFCDYFDGMVTNQAEFNRIGEAYSQNAFTKLDVCMYGDGNVLSKFNIAKEMATVTDLFTNIQTYYDYENPTSVKYIDKEKSVTRIQGWIDAMEKYRLGIYIDSNPSLTTDDNPQFALSSYNKKTKYFYPNGTRNPNCPRDVWVFDKANCTDPNAQIYNATDQTYGLKFTILNDLCISFNEKLVADYSHLWDENDITKRYQQIIHTCPDAYTDIIRFGRSLSKFRDARNNTFQGLKDSLNALKTKHVQFNKDLVSYKARVDAFYSSVSTLNNLVTDKISGLLVSSDCRVISDYLKVTNNVLCKNVMAQVSVLGICCVLLLCVMIGGILTACVFSVRYARIETSQKHSKRIVIPQSSIHSETFEKRKNSQSSSSSSSDED